MRHNMFYTLPQISDPTRKLVLNIHTVQTVENRYSYGLKEKCFVRTERDPGKWVGRFVDDVAAELQQMGIVLVKFSERGAGVIPETIWINPYAVQFVSNACDAREGGCTKTGSGIQLRGNPEGIVWVDQKLEQVMSMLGDAT